MLKRMSFSLGGDSSSKSGNDDNNNANTTNREEGGAGGGIDTDAKDTTDDAAAVNAKVLQERLGSYSVASEEDESEMSIGSSSKRRTSGSIRSSFNVVSSLHHKLNVARANISQKNDLKLREPLMRKYQVVKSLKEARADVISELEAISSSQGKSLVTVMPLVHMLSISLLEEYNSNAKTGYNKWLRNALVLKNWISLQKQAFSNEETVETALFLLDLWLKQGIMADSYLLERSRFFFETYFKQVGKDNVHRVDIWLKYCNVSIQIRLDKLYSYSCRRRSSRPYALQQYTGVTKYSHAIILYRIFILLTFHHS